MKKFGTPIGAGPGSDSEKLGFDGLGTPLPFGRPLALGFLLLALILALALAWPGALAFGWCEEGGCTRRRVGVGVLERRVDVVEDEDVEVEVEVELGGLGEVVEELVLVDRGGGLVAVLVLVLEGVGTQDSVSETTTPEIGSLMAEIGVPGGTFTLKVRVWPVRSLTVIVQASAEALGSAAMPSTTNIAATSTTILHSFRLPSNVARLLHVSPVCAGQFDAGRLRRAEHATDWSGALQRRTVCPDPAPIHPRPQTIRRALRRSSTPCASRAGPNRADIAKTQCVVEP